MFKLTKIHAQNLMTKKLYGEFYATTKEEVTDEAEIIGMPDGYGVDDGSFVYTHKAELGIYDSNDGGWDFGDEESNAKSLLLARPSLEKTVSPDETEENEEQTNEEKTVADDIESDELSR